MTTGFLGALADGDRDALLATGRRRHFARGASLFVEGDDSTHVVLVITGRVKVFTVSDSGREALLAVAGPGDLLGELSALDKQPRSATVTAIEPVDAAVVATGAFENFLAGHPRAAVHLLRLVSRRLREADRLRAEFSLGAEGRIAGRLLELADEHGKHTSEGIEITLPLTQDEMAAWVGVTREAVARALRGLRERGAITTGRRRIVIRDQSMLREAAI